MQSDDGSTSIYSSAYIIVLVWLTLMFIAMLFFFAAVRSMSKCFLSSAWSQSKLSRVSVIRVEHALARIWVMIALSGRLARGSSKSNSFVMNVVGAALSGNILRCSFGILKPARSRCVAVPSK